MRARLSDGGEPIGAIQGREGGLQVKTGPA
jgi:hypothetical protein